MLFCKAFERWNFVTKKTGFWDVGQAAVQQAEPVVRSAVQVALPIAQTAVQQVSTLYSILQNHILENLHWKGQSEEIFYSFWSHSINNFFFRISQIPNCQLHLNNWKTV